MYVCGCVYSVGGVEDPQHSGAKSDHADIVSMWWLATGHSGATLDVISILNVTLSKPITIHWLVSPEPRSPFNLTVMLQRGEGSQTSSPAL